MDEFKSFALAYAGAKFNFVFATFADRYPKNQVQRIEGGYLWNQDRTTKNWKHMARCDFAFLHGLKPSDEEHMAIIKKFVHMRC